VAVLHFVRTGNAGALGDRDGGPTRWHTQPHFPDAASGMAAPALLGFDEEIEEYCQARGGYGNHAETCIRANHNILSLYGDVIPYNMVRWLEDVTLTLTRTIWCAASKT
jgi:hypothetical protein